MSSAKKKDKKRRYTYLNLNDFKIENDFQTETYRNFIINFLMTRGNLKKTEAEKYTEDMNLYIQAVTHDSVIPTDLTFNYEMLEHLGDETVNKCATWYLKNRFPQIMKRGDKGVSIFSSQRAILKAKPKLAEFCQRIGLVNFIRYRKLEYEFYKEGLSLQSTSKLIEQKNIKSIVMDNSMKEDAFEAFFAAIEMTIDNTEGMIGIGYSVVFKILSSIFDEETISIYPYDLIDFKTQLKEIFDKRRATYKDKETYQSVKTDDGNTISLEISIHTGPILQGDLASGDIRQANIPRDITMVFGPLNTRVSKDNEEDYDSTAKQVEQQLAKQALEWLGQNLGIYRYKPNVDYSSLKN
jgi:dsRNA-specific ribonuclease